MSKRRVGEEDYECSHPVGRGEEEQGTKNKLKTGMHNDTVSLIPRLPYTSYFSQREKLGQGSLGTRLCQCLSYD